MLIYVESKVFPVSYKLQYIVILKNIFYLVLYCVYVFNVYDLCCIVNIEEKNFKIIKKYQNYKKNLKNFCTYFS